MRQNTPSSLPKRLWAGLTLRMHFIFCPIQQKHSLSLIVSPILSLFEDIKLIGTRLDITEHYPLIIWPSGDSLIKRDLQAIRLAAGLLTGPSLVQTGMGVQTTASEVILFSTLPQNDIRAYRSPVFDEFA